jgi:hypothetical protein
MRPMIMTVCGLLCSAATAFAGPKATVVSLKGECTVTRGSASVPARVKMALEESDVLVTGHRSSVEILLDNGALVMLDADTVVELSRLHMTSDHEEVRIALSLGRILASVRKLVSPSSTFSIRTKTSVAAVRGTEYVVEAASDSTDVGVFEGTVNVAALDAPDDASAVLVRRGEQTTVPVTGGPLPAFVMSARMRTHQARMDALRRRAEMHRRSLERILREREKTGARMQEYWNRRLQQLPRR